MKYLYHGSTVKVDELRPSKAYGYGGEADCLEGVYATEHIEFAIPFTLTIEDASESSLLHVDTSEVPPSITLKMCRVNWDVSGYLYKLPMDLFEKVSEFQWVSKESVKPIEIIEVDPKKYRNWIKYE